MRYWGGTERKVSKRQELKDVSMCVYTEPGGLLGRLVGRALRFRVDHFSYVLDTQKKSLKGVVVEADSLVPECEVVSGSKLDRLRLTSFEVQRVARRTHEKVLNVSRYPLISYDVTRETTNEIEGTLHLHGESHPLTCSKMVEGKELVVRCLISLKQHRLPPYKLWLGLLSVSDRVEIETRVPASVLKL